MGEKPVNPHVCGTYFGAIKQGTYRANGTQVGFYKTNAGPIAKVLLMATFVYQLTYWGWVKLEKEEKKREMSGE